MLPGGWRSTLLFGCLASLGIMALNIGLLVVALWRDPRPSEPSRILQTDYPKRISETSTILHAVANVLGTVLLAASNSCMRILMAPMPSQLEKLHSAGRRMRIGVLSFRNLREHSWWRSFVVAILALSSVPLHFLYNSVLTMEEMPIQYAAGVVNAGFYSGANLSNIDPSALSQYNGADAGTGSNRAHAFNPQPWVGLLGEIQANMTTANMVGNVSWYECALEFRKGLMAFNRAILMNAVNANGSSPVELLVLEDYGFSFGHKQKGLESTAIWLCQDVDADHCQIYNETALAFTFAYGQDIFTVDSCLIASAEPRASIKVNISILAAVILSNIIKCACIFTTFMLITQNPILTVGDAISNFLEEAAPWSFRDDMIIESMGVRTDQQVLNSRALDINTPTGWAVWSRPKYSAVGFRKWMATMVLSSLLIVIGVVILVLHGGKLSGPGSRYVWDLMQDANLVPKNLVLGLQFTPLLQLVLISNLPQFLISIAYLHYNNLFAAMLAAVELYSLATCQAGKPLRVSFPRGGQKRDFFMQIPRRYTFWFMVAMACLHFVVSLAFGAIDTRVYPGYDIRPMGRSDPYGFMIWNQAAVVYSLAVGTLMILFLVISGLMPLPKGMPVGNLDTRHIQGLCKMRSEMDSPDFTLMPLRYGALSPTSGKPHFVGFSARVDEMVSLKAAKG